MAATCKDTQVEIVSEITPARVIPIEERTVSVIHFLNGEDSPLQNTKKYCNLDFPLKFKIMYRPETSRTEIDRQSLLKENGEMLGQDDLLIIFCNSLVEKGKFADESIREKLFIFLIENREVFRIIPTVIYYVVCDEKRRDFLSFEDDFLNFMRNHQDLGEQVLHLLQTSTKLLNVSYEQKYEGYLKTIKVGDKIILKRQVLTKAENENKTLECEWWFSEEILKAFGCGKGRLIQQSGTCFLTAVINGLILSDSARNLCIEAMNAQVAKDLELKDIVKKPISDLACPSFAKGRATFFYNILFNIMCKNPQDRLPPTLDVFIHASAKYFCLDTTITNPSHAQYGLAGSAISALINLLYDMSIDGFVFLEQYKGKQEQFQRLTIVANTDFKLMLVRKYWLNLYSSNIDEKDLHIPKRKCCVYILPEERLKNIERTIQVGHEQTQFQLSFGLIKFKAMYLDDRIIGHVILGLFCNDIPILYDSSLNRFFDCDWTRLEEDEVQKKLLKIYKEWFHAIKEITDVFKLECGFYINQKEIEKPKEICVV